MDYLEPHFFSLFWFVLLWSACCLGFLQLAGMYPIAPSTDGPRLTALVVSNTALWLALFVGTLAFGCKELRWTTVLVVSGLLFLFIPALFQILPRHWRDGRSGMITAGCILATALAVLCGIATEPLRSIITWIH